MVFQRDVLRFPTPTLTLVTQTATCRSMMILTHSLHGLVFPKIMVHLELMSRLQVNIGRVILMVFGANMALLRVIP